MGLMDLETAYDRVSRGSLGHVLRMYDVGGKLVNGIKTGMYHVPLTFQCIYGCCGD